MQVPSSPPRRLFTFIRSPSAIRPPFQPPAKREPRRNERIRIPEVVLIDETGQNRGVIPTARALEMAQARELDLVEVNPIARPPVCRIIDFGKYQYQKEKQLRKTRAKKIEIKAIRLSFKIGEHDRDMRKSQALKFLDQGHKVKLEMILRGRENAHRERARDLVNGFLKDLGDDVRVEQELKKIGNRLSVVATRIKK